MRRSHKTPYGKIRLYASNPHDSEVNVLVVPGFSESITHNRQLVTALGSLGFNAFTHNQPRRNGKGDPIDRQAQVVLSTLEANRQNDNKVHAVGHSLGSAAVLKAAQQAPELFESITLMQPVGMVGNQKFSELLKRTVKKTFKNQIKALRSQNPDRRPINEYAASADRESALRFFGRAALAQVVSGILLTKQLALAAREAIAAGKYDITEDIAKVKELAIPVHIVAAANDEIFDADKVDERCEKITDSVSSYSIIADQRAGHDTFWMQRERTAEVVSQQINHTIR